MSGVDGMGLATPLLNQYGLISPKIATLFSIFKLFATKIENSCQINTIPAGVSLFVTSIRFIAPKWQGQ